MLPPEAHAEAEAAAGVEAAVAVSDAIVYAFDQVTKGSAYVNPQARQGLVDELELKVQGRVEREHQLGLVDQLECF